MKDEKYKVMVAACKECGTEFEMRIPNRDLRSDGCRVRRGRRDPSVRGSVPGLPRARSVSEIV